MRAFRLGSVLAALSGAACSSVLGLDDLSFEPQDAGTSNGGMAGGMSFAGGGAPASGAPQCAPGPHDQRLLDPGEPKASASCAEASLSCEPRPDDCSPLLVCDGAAGAQFRRIPYQLDPAFDAQERATVHGAAAAWSRASSLINFAPCPNDQCVAAREASWYHFQPLRATQPIAARTGERVFVLNTRSPHQIAHDLGHVLGLVDGWRRADRDRHLALSGDYFCGEPSERLEAARCVPLASDDRYRPDIEFGTSGAFDARSKMNVVSRFICPRGGVFPDLDSFEPTAGDGSAVSELYRTLGGWRPFRPALTRRDAGPEAHLLRDGVELQGGLGVSSSLYPELSIWATGSDGRVYVKSKLTTSVGFAGWSEWDDVGSGTFDSDPAAISWTHTEPTHVVVRQLGGEIAWTRSVAGGSGWQEWQAIGAPPGGAASAPALASRGPNRLDVFVRSQLDDRLYSKRFEGSWAPDWVLAGDLAFTGKPSAVARGELIDVVVTGLDGAIWRLSSSPLSGNRLESLGGSAYPGSSPAIATYESELVVFMRGAKDSRLYANFLQGGWTGWEELGGILAGDPAAITSSTGQLEVVAPIDDNGTVGAWWRVWSRQALVVE